MKKTIALMAAAAMVISLVGCGGGSSGGSSADTQAAGGGAEAAGGETQAEGGAAEAAPAAEEVSGSVMIYTSMYQDVIDMMSEALADAFPNLDVTFYYGGTGDIQAKVTTEMEAGKLGCDMLLVAEPAYSLELKELDMLHPYISDQAENLRFDYDEEGYWYPVRVCNMVLAYDSAQNSKDSLVDSFEKFATDPSLTGAICMGNPLTSGTTMAAIVSLQDKYGDEYFTNLGKQGVVLSGGTAAVEGLETGEYKEIMILEESILKIQQERAEAGADCTLEVIYPSDGNILIPSTVMTIAADKSLNDNTAACEAITDWLLSEAGQQYVVKGWMHSVLKDFPELPYNSVDTDGLIETDMGVDWERCYKERDAIRTLFEENVMSE